MFFASTNYTGKARNSYCCGTFYPYEIGVKSYELRNNVSIFYYAKSREWQFTEDYCKNNLRLKSFVIVFNCPV